MRIPFKKRCITCIDKSALKRKCRKVILSASLKVIIKPSPISSDNKVVIVVFYIVQETSLCCHCNGSLSIEARDGAVNTPCISIMLSPGHNWNANSLLRVEVAYNTVLAKVQKRVLPKFK